MTILVATTVVRGARQGESHGGIYLVDFDNERVARPVDWNATDIDWQGRGGDRGLRGIAFDGEKVYVAASDDLLVYDRDFNQLVSYRSPHLKNCHEICRYKRRLYLASTGYDAILGFDLDALQFTWGLKIGTVADGFRGTPFMPGAVDGPPPSSELHINSVFGTAAGLFIGGMHTAGLLRYSGKRIEKIIPLPTGCNNAQPWRGGVVFHDTGADVVRYVSEDKRRTFPVPRYDPVSLTNTDFEDPKTARQGFGRGLCDVGDGVVAAGSSPSTITLYDFEAMQTLLSINLTMDVRESIHGLEVWPFDSE